VDLHQPIVVFRHGSAVEVGEAADQCVKVRLLRDRRPRGSGRRCSDRKAVAHDASLDVAAAF
jgi:hypothetical protein